MSNIGQNLLARTRDAIATREAEEQARLQQAREDAAAHDLPKLLEYFEAAAANGNVDTEYNLAYGDNFSDYDHERAQALVAILTHNNVAANYTVRACGDHSNSLVIKASWANADFIEEKA